MKDLSFIFFLLLATRLLFFIQMVKGFAFEQKALTGLFYLNKLCYLPILQTKTKMMKKFLSQPLQSPCKLKEISLPASKSI